MTRGSRKTLQKTTKQSRTKKVSAKKSGSSKTRTPKKSCNPKASAHRLSQTALMSRDLNAKYPAASQWMILEVNDDGESLFERYELIEAELLEIFGNETPFFIPSYIEKIKDKVVGLDLIGGYVFVQKNESSESVAASMTSRNLKGIMVERGRSASVTGADINNYKKRLQQSIQDLAPKKGSLVVPKVGTFKNIEGRVVSVSRDKKSATVVFSKSSRTVQAPVSVLNMEPAVRS